MKSERSTGWRPSELNDPSRPTSADIQIPSIPCPLINRGRPPSKSSFHSTHQAPLIICHATPLRSYKCVQRCLSDWSRTPPFRCQDPLWRQLHQRRYNQRPQARRATGSGVGRDQCGLGSGGIVYRQDSRQGRMCF
jgi:hypothetical protein